MVTHATSAQVLRFGCLALMASCSKSGTDATRKRVAEAGGLDALLSFLRMHVPGCHAHNPACDAESAEHCCIAISCLRPHGEEDAAVFATMLEASDALELLDTMPPEVPRADVPCLVPDSEKRAEVKKKAKKRGKKKKQGGGGGAGPSQEPAALAEEAAEEAVAAAEEAELAAALEESARLEEGRRAAEAQGPSSAAEAPAPREEEPPADFICPITTELMSDPVMAADGHSYERSAMHRALARDQVDDPWSCTWTLGCHHEFFFKLRRSRKKRQRKAKGGMEGRDIKVLLRVVVTGSGHTYSYLRDCFSGSTCCGRI